MQQCLPTELKAREIDASRRWSEIGSGTFIRMSYAIFSQSDAHNYCQLARKSSRAFSGVNHSQHNRSYFDPIKLLTPLKIFQTNIYSKHWKFFLQSDAFPIDIHLILYKSRILPFAMEVHYLVKSHSFWSQHCSKLRQFL